MILTERILWSHLPKTAGTSTDLLFLRSGIPFLWRDPQDSPSKHLPAEEHPGLGSLLATPRVRVINIRRLPLWLLSSHQHKLHSMQLTPESEPLAQGLFYRHRLQAWLPADWWLERFGVDEQWSFLRVEHLKRDFSDLLQRHQPVGLRSRIRIALTGARNRKRYDRRLSAWFSSEQLRRIYGANPRWAALEERLYGSLLG